MFDTLLLRLSLHCNTPLDFTTLHSTTLHYTSHFTTLYPTTLHYTYRHFRRVKVASAYCWKPYHIHGPIFRKAGSLILHM